MTTTGYILCAMALLVVIACITFIMAIGIEIAEYFDYEVPKWLKKLMK